MWSQGFSPSEVGRITNCLETLKEFLNALHSVTFRRKIWNFYSKRNIFFFAITDHAMHSDRWFENISTNIQIMTYTQKKKLIIWNKYWTSKLDKFLVTLPEHDNIRSTTVDNFFRIQYVKNDELKKKKPYTYSG